MVVSPAVARSVKAAIEQQEEGVDMSTVGAMSGTVTAEVTAQVTTPQVTTEPERPKDYDPKSSWVDWVVSRGADRDKVEELTKAQIIELYG